MGLACSKKGSLDEEGEVAPTIVRLSPFRPRRCSSLSRRMLCAAGAPGAGAPGDCAVPSLLSLAADAAAAGLAALPAHALAALPADLSQLLLERLVSTAMLDDAAIARLASLGLHFFSLPLGGYPELVRPAWLRCLASPSLEAADLSKTGVTDEALASLGCPPRLARLRLDYCVEITDAGLALLQGLTALQELSLAGCEQVTPLGLRCLAGLARLRRLNLQACHAVTGLSALHALRQLEALDLGWCGSVHDADAEAISHFSRLQELSLAHTRIGDAGLAHLNSLCQLRVLNLAGLCASDDSLATLLCQLPRLHTLVLDRCKQAGDKALQAVSKHAPQLRELGLVSTAVSDKGLQQLGGLQQLQALNLETCLVGDRGLEVLSRLTALRRLDLSETRAGNGAMSFVGKLQQLESLNLACSGVNDSGLRRLNRLTRLRCLNLDSRLFTDAGMAHVAKLASLECLDLFTARISDAGCAAISALTNLRRLEVCGGDVTDAGVASLAALSKLQHLSLAQNHRIGNAAIQHLIKLNDLTALSLSKCHVTSNSVVALGCLPQLQTLALYETRVRPMAVDKLLAANPELLVQGVPASGAASRASSCPT